MSRFYTVLIFMCMNFVAALAQNGALSGTITETETKKPVVGASIRVIKTKSEETVKGAYSGSTGKYTINDLAPGSYRVLITSVGFKKYDLASVQINSGETTTLNTVLEPESINFNNVVVTASRKEEKALEAPASISVVDPVMVAERPALAVTEHLKGLPGVDFAQTGISQQTTVTRGFNNVFSGMLLTLADYRIAGVPSLRVNVPYFIPLVNDDIERMELVRGPGSALYGPNATQGVLNIISKSPFASQGTSISVAGGERNLFNGTLRHAGVIGEDFGFKISGQYITADDWMYSDSVETRARTTAIAAGATEDTLKIGKRDPKHQRFSVDARADYLITEDLKTNFSVGLSHTLRSVEMTGVGAAQAMDWGYYYVQGRVDYGNLFIQAFLNQSNAGESFLLRDGSKIVDNSRLIVGRIQHSYELNEMQTFTYGGDAFFTTPETEGTITGRNEDDDDIQEFGAYLQSESHLFDNVLDVILAGRIDIHSRLTDPVFSPRAALVLKPDANNNIRITFNRAFNIPSTNELFLDIVAARNPFSFPKGYEIDFRASGVPEGGYIFERNGDLKFRSPFSPDAIIPVAGVSSLWGAATSVVSQVAASKVPQALAPLVPAILQILNSKTPTASDFSGIMAIIDPTSGTFNRVTDVIDIPELKPTINQTIETGYKGVFGDALQVGVDIYYSQVSNVIGPLQVFTPNVFFNRDQLLLYMSQNVQPDIKNVILQADTSYTDAQAEVLSQFITSFLVDSGYARLPLGTVTPNGAADPRAVMLAYRNAGDIDLWGTDISMEFALNKMFSLTGTYSLLKLLERDEYPDSAKITGTYIEKIDGVSDYALNAPEHKASFGVRFHEQELGLRAGIQYRYNDGFRMNSGVYIGHVEHSNIVDVTLGYDIPWVQNLKLDVSATNIFDNRTQYFVGAPEIGRLVMARLGYTF